MIKQLIPSVDGQICNAMFFLLLDNRKIQPWAVKCLLFYNGNSMAKRFIVGISLQATILCSISLYIPDFSVDNDNKIHLLTPANTLIWKPCKEIIINLHCRKEMPITTRPQQTKRAP